MASNSWQGGEPAGSSLERLRLGLAVQYHTVTFAHAEEGDKT
jgi:hypothetical protein